MANGFDELADFLRGPDRKQFTPKPYLEPETESLIFYVRDVPSYSHRLNEIFTLFLADSDNSLVGCEIKGVTRLLRRSAGFLSIVHDHKIKLTILIALALAPEPDADFAELDDTLHQLREFARDQEVDTGELCLAE